jgi:hypothetical protein
MIPQTQNLGGCRRGGADSEEPNVRDLKSVQSRYTLGSRSVAGGESPFFIGEYHGNC